MILVEFPSDLFSKESSSGGDAETGFDPRVPTAVEPGKGRSWRKALAARFEPLIWNDDDR